MNNDELRDDAKILALTETVRALLGAMRDQNSNAVAAIASTVDDLILDGDVGDDALKASAVEYRRKVLFKPPY